VSTSALLLRLDATHETGMGHAMRMRHLADALASRPRLVVVGRGTALADLFPEALRYPDPAQLERVARETGARLWLNDTPAFQPEEWGAMAIPGIVIDDFGGDFPAHLAINGTVLPEYHHYPHLARGGRALCGGEYSLLHPAFAANVWTPPATRRVTIIVGGGERALEWSRRLFSGELDFSAWGAVTACFGRAFPAFPELAERAAARGVTARQGLPAGELAAMLAASSAALITGGMVLYEAMAVGVPTLVFPQLHNLEAEAAWFAGHGCALDLGFDGGMDLERVAAEMSRLLADPDLTARQSANARLAIDGHGLIRAAAAVDALLSEHA
jgi:spore coat polysaccharide biosynthesis predicted glycosyltransferase SpsG